MFNKRTSSLELLFSTCIQSYIVTKVKEPFACAHIFVLLLADGQQVGSGGWKGVVLFFVTLHVCL
jgi:hypothetical protein